jgi:hypothetical protein
VIDIQTSYQQIKSDKVSITRDAQYMVVMLNGRIDYYKLSAETGEASRLRPASKSLSFPWDLKRDSVQVEPNTAAWKSQRPIASDARGREPALEEAAGPSRCWTTRRPSDNN